MSVNLRVVTLFTVVLCLLGFSAFSEKIVIAHRGASGYVNEHTLAAYAMAYGMGADYIEQDLGMTRDGVLICMHDRTLERTSNVAEVFPDRKRENGKYYPEDFTLAEIKSLRAVESVPMRFPRALRLFQMVTFEEAIQLIQGLNTSTGRDVGIYPELKDAGSYEKAGLPFLQTFLDVLSRYGYEGPDAKVYVQCFSSGILKQLREEYQCTLPLIQLMSSDMVEKADMKEVAAYAQGIGPDKKAIDKDPTVVARAHEAGLKVHPYTFRADAYSSKYKNVNEEMELFLFTYDIDGGFTDHPDVMRQVIDAGKK
ncbi:MAG: glycerophosphodiester phosphodiesterase [Candidatus Hydrogenedens sp.]|nr:glycerophosphodiester phosphodiesterase [Candidatus Hydrogenedens sp.]